MRLFFVEPHSQPLEALAELLFAGSHRKPTRHAELGATRVDGSLRAEDDDRYQTAPAAHPFDEAGAIRAHLAIADHHQTRLEIALASFQLVDAQRPYTQRTEHRFEQVPQSHGLFRGQIHEDGLLDIEHRCLAGQGVVDRRRFLF